MSAIRVLIVDDHPVVREGLHRMLEVEEDIEIVGKASSGEEALLQAGLSLPHLVLMDIRMPGMSGLEAIQLMRRRHPLVSVIALTLYGDQYLAQAIEAGAVGYLLKDTNRDELVNAIRAVHHGEATLDPTLCRELFNQFANLVKTRSAAPWVLDRREQDVLQLVASGGTNRDIASQMFLSESTIKREIRSIFDKLGVKHRSEAVSQAYKKGLL